MRGFGLDEFRRTPAGKRNAQELDKVFGTQGRKSATTRGARERLKAEGASVGEIHDEEKFIDLLAEVGIPAPVTEYRFASSYNNLNQPSKYRFDYAWPDVGLALEVDGGTFMAVSGHSSSMGIQEDMRKINQATVEGWRMLRYTPQQLLKPETIQQVREAYYGGWEMGGCGCFED